MLPERKGLVETKDLNAEAATSRLF